MADALLHTLAGLYDSRGEYLNQGLARELAERLMQRDSAVKRRRMGRVWVLTVDPDLYRDEVRAWIASEPRIQVWFEGRAPNIEHSNPNEGSTERRVTALDLEGSLGSCRVSPAALVDATGRGAIVASIDPSLRCEHPQTAAGGWVFRMRGVAAAALAFPRGAALLRSLRDAVTAGQLPPECDKAWIDQGVAEDEAFVKLFVPLGPDWMEREARAEISDRARQTQAVLADFLRTQPGFEAARVTQSGQLGVRDGGRVQGEYTLTRADVLALRRFDDPACRCAWPIEYWDSKTGVSLEYLPDGAYYEVPMQSLKLRSFVNLWVAGKCLSADPFAQASARCVGTCWAMGEAVGKRAASLHEVAATSSDRGIA
jgi:hypothetical protein